MSCELCERVSPFRASGDPFALGACSRSGDIRATPCSGAQKAARGCSSPAPAEMQHPAVPRDLPGSTCRISG